ncbi:hypothetical protein HAX54_053113 [Datura stramonium]|uniref:COBRA C-terminal domain-containing protein n=1 Tax=Datura stramonium TaxID=4076 RepID=A0ABS8WS59_DATST|nr:hypothetical protein [Datura stramonium]
MWGAEATEQGDCSAFKGGIPPHCCEKQPVIVDLLPGAPYNKQVFNCCKGGVLTSLTQDPGKYGASFEMSVGSVSNEGSGPRTPENFTLGIPGYTCGDPVQVPPSKFTVDQGRRKTQAVANAERTCSYSQFRASYSPTCCVSLSAFYDKTIVSCPKCSCGCQGQFGADQCVKHGELPPVLQLDHNEPPRPVLECSHHMCPIQPVELGCPAPEFEKVTQVFSFNYKPRRQWECFMIKYYNDKLLLLWWKWNCANGSSHGRRRSKQEENKQSQNLSSEERMHKEESNGAFNPVRYQGLYYYYESSRGTSDLA